MFYGSIVALITPFKDGQVDWAAIPNLVNWHIDQGTNGIVACASTGESLLLSSDEHRRIAEVIIKTVAKRVPVLVGTGAISTEETIKLTQQAKELGADGALIVTPAYVRPTQEALYQHYKTVQDSVSLPIVIYNNPSRAGVELSNETLARLSELPYIVGVKDSTGDLARPTALRRLAGADFVQLTGEDATTSAFLAAGGHGGISVSANVAPKLCAALCDTWQQQDLKKFAEIRDRLNPICEAMFVETNPVPVKYAVSLLGKCTDEMRLPLLPTTDHAKAVVQKAMEHAGVLEAGNVILEVI